MLEPIRKKNLEEKLDRKKVRLFKANILGSISLNKLLKSYIKRNKPATLARIKRGHSFLKEKKMILGKFDAVDIKNGIDWQSNPLENRTWQWHLNCFSFIGDVISFDHVNHSDSNLDCIAMLLSDWAQKYNYTEINFDFEFIWHDQATALRAEQVAVFLNYLFSFKRDWANRNQPLIVCLIGVLKRHAEVLSSESFYSANNNHGLTQARVLLLLSNLFSNFTDADNFKKVALERIEKELDHAFTEEGVHVENSPAYHYFVLKVILSIISDNPYLQTTQFGQKFSNISKKALVYLTHIIQPNGKLPIIGDSEEIKINDLFKSYFGKTVEYKNFSHIIRKGKKGIQPDPCFGCYPKSGYAIFRKKLSDNSGCEDDLHLIFKAGCLSKYHSHRDEGSIIFSFGGEKWLIDSGMFNYNYESKVRKYMTSRIAHNVVHVSSTKYRSDYNKFNQRWIIDECCKKDNNYYVASQLMTYENVLIKRAIVICSDKNHFQVNDKIFLFDDNSDDSTKHVFFYWHFDSDKSISFEDDTKINIKSKKSSKKVKMIIRPSSEFAVFKLVGMKKNDKIYSIISKTANEYEHSSLIKVKCKIQKEMECRTEFDIIS
jgi:hypothetical protein